MEYTTSRPKHATPELRAPLTGALASDYARASPSRVTLSAANVQRLNAPFVSVVVGQRPPGRLLSLSIQWVPSSSTLVVCSTRMRPERWLSSHLSR